MTNALKALIYGLRVFPFSFEKGCFINGVFDLELQDVMSQKRTDVITPSYQSAKKFQGHHYRCFPSFQEDIHYDSCFVLLPKQKDQALYDVAMALTYLNAGGHIVLCAANDAGGKRIPDILSVFGLESLHSLSKNHCKYAVARKTNIYKRDAVDYCIQQGGFQKGAHGYSVKPGIFGWNKVDIGSQVLAGQLPNNLSGEGGDFGCGYGYLTDQVFLKNANVEKMTCFDSDYHAIQACQKNLDTLHNNRHFETIWADLTNQCPVKPLNFIVMNPPFHDGKDQDTALGKKMITTAHDALGKYGELYMVANNHLPYEAPLKDLFFQVDVLAAEKGFKIFKALK
ncbi:MAG: class I SAM-dependent methyltransferase [Bdellovibrionales bacterium]